MLTKEADKKREQIMMFCMDDLVENKYSSDTGRPSMDPVMLTRIPFIQYLYGTKSMRQTMKEIEANVAYRWFLGLEMYEKARMEMKAGLTFACMNLKKLARMKQRYELCEA